LPEVFSERVILIDEIAGRKFLAGATSSETSSSAIDQPFGETPQRGSSDGREAFSRGQRILNGLSGARAGGRVQAISKSKELNMASFEKGI